MMKPRDVVTDDLGVPLPTASITVSEEDRASMVVYRNDKGDRFRLKFVQRPNPIGFRAKLPGTLKTAR